jgi:hypothetical protein
MKILPLVSILALGFALPVYAAEAVTKTEPPAAAATAPMSVAPEVMQATARLGVMQGHMNALLAQRDSMDAQIKALQMNIDRETAMRDKLSK